MNSTAILCLLASYLLGAIPFGLVVSRGSGIDIRTQGSRNIGATNVARLLGKKMGALTLGLDLLKGFVPMFFAALLVGDAPRRDLIVALCGAATVLGHMFPVYLGFKGGKGVATGAGMLLGLAPVEFAVAMTVFGLVFTASRYVSLGSISAACAFPLTMFTRENLFNVDIQGYHTLIFFAIGTALLLVFTHRENIHRLIQGTESKLTSFHGSKHP